MTRIGGPAYRVPGRYLPKADAQLHIVIGDIAQGIETMQGKHPGKGRPLGVVEVSRAMNTYGEYFNHPGWQAIKLPH